MVFNSPVFLFLFLPLALGLHAVAPRGLRNLVLLAASLLFYSWGDAWSLPVLVAATIANYALGLAVERTGRGRGGAAVLGLAVAANLGLLVYFKYLKFAVTNLAAMGLADPSVVDFSGWRLPLGVSFFTFGSISYLVDIRRGVVRAERNPVDFGLYMAMFPKIVAGPIARYADLARELKDRRMTLEGFAEGVQRFAVGLGKKVLLAGPVAAVADEAFRMQGLDAPTAWLGILCYTAQIYFDFSGYSDMAIGLGRMFGFSIMENFNYPYVSQSVQEFWRRWHISLSTWYRDYLYIPLGGSRVPPWRIYFNLVTVFLLCGLWHGANWTFVVWGLWHGLFLALERAWLGKLLKQAWRPLRHAYALLAVVVGWVFFRADDMPHALAYLGAMFSPGGNSFAYFRMTFVSNELLVVLALSALAAAPLVPYLRGRLDGKGALLGEGAAAVLVMLILAASIMQMAASTFSPFIYTKF